MKFINEPIKLLAIPMNNSFAGVVYLISRCKKQSEIVKKVIKETNNSPKKRLFSSFDVTVKTLPPMAQTRVSPPKSNDNMFGNLGK